MIIIQKYRTEALSAKAARRQFRIKMAFLCLDIAYALGVKDLILKIIAFKRSKQSDYDQF